MKWIMLFFISAVPDTDQIDLFGFPELPFNSKEECHYTVATNYVDLQQFINNKYETSGVVYPVTCISEYEFNELTGNLY